MLFIIAANADVQARDFSPFIEAPRGAFLSLARKWYWNYNR